MGPSCAPFASMLQMCAALLVLGSGTGAATVTEYVGMAPSHAFPDNGGEPQPLKWAELTYNPAGNRAAAVRLSLLNASAGIVEEVPPPLGKWLDLDLTKGGGGGAALTAKVHKNKLYIYVDKRPAPPNSPGLGCCADTLRIVDRDTGKTTEWDLDAILGTVFPENSTFHKATHTFDIMEGEGGVVFAFLMVQYSAPDALGLGAVLTNGVVAFSTSTGLVHPTADGVKLFGFAERLGTLSSAPTDSVFKLQYYKHAASPAPPPRGDDDEEQGSWRRRAEEGGGGGVVEQWHGNGLLLFTSRGGVRLLAFTHRGAKEAVVLRDPWVYSAQKRGGQIVQRFGTPQYGQLAVVAANQSGVTSHAFGVPAHTPAFTGGVHNLFHTAASPTASLRGRETLSLFVNSVQGGVSSFAYEFELKLAPPQRPGVPPTDAVFATASVHAACPFQSFAEGGARTIGDGVFLVASGLIFPKQGMLAAIDVSGGAGVSLLYPRQAHTSLYDPFVRVMVTNSTAIL